MSDFDLDFSQLDEWNRNLESIERDFPRESKQMLQRVGNKAKSIVSKKAKELVKKDTGRYHKSIKRGKVWDAAGGLNIRVYSTDEKKFLIENGHRIVDKNGVEHGFQPGTKVFEKSERDVSDNFVQIVAEQMNRTFDRL
jgi:hypothetical protein